MCFAVQNQQLIAWCTPYLLLYSLYCISNFFCNILKYSLLCVQFYLFFSKIPPSNIWFVVYDGIPCWNMIGQKEDRLLYPNTGQAFSIDTISQETSRLASWKSPLNISLLSKNDGNAVARSILLVSKIVRKQGPLQIKN